MIVEIFALCGAAVDLPQLGILNVFDLIQVKQFPTVHRCSLALRVRFSRTEAGDHNMAIHVMDEDGGQLCPPTALPFGIAFFGEHGDSQAANVCFNLALPLEKEGIYSVDLAIDRQQEASLPFRVVLAR